MRYQPQNIEAKWQKIWEDKKAFFTETDPEKLKLKPKYYVLDMFPYPSGAGLHVGHPEGYTATDIIARYKRMQGFHVLHPMGWDAFGLPAERAAMRENKHPAAITKRNVDNFREQIKRLGFSYDWEREINTSSVDYYQWTQWIFLKLYEKDLAYMAEVPVNWCPALGTVLANEEVKDGKYVETGDPVERRMMKQWMLKITAYAERLLQDLDEVDWPEGVKEMQRNWIGKSIGAQVNFKIQDSDFNFEVFTTRPDTLFGATYCVLAPEHPLVEKILSDEQKTQALQYIKEAKNKSDLLRTDLAKEKSGVFSGAYAINPATNQAIPIWIADYVLMSYGSGAIMAVPAHDERDHEFATQFKLPIIEVVSGSEKPITEAAYTGDGKLINSDFLNGFDVHSAKEKMTAWLEEKKLGKKQVQYRLRDWLFSRQRYWGEPFPILHIQNDKNEEEGKEEIIPIDEKDLPVALPNIDEYKPTKTGAPPLARAQDWLQVTLPDGRTATRETNTMPQWAGSCWYYLRYLDPQNQEAPFSQASENYWMPVDLYIGGVEHAVLHLLYARFWHKVLYDCGLVHTKEPFQKLFNQGMILAYSYRDQNGKYYHPSDIEEREGQHFVKGTQNQVQSNIEKMSKSKLNVVNPDEVIEQYGADAMRLYELFMGPLEQTKPWQMEGVEGVYRFLGRVWRLFVDEQTGALQKNISQDAAESNLNTYKLLQQSIDKVTQDIENLRFNTAISQMMIFVKESMNAANLPQSILEDFLKILAPFAPHICEEIWQKLGHTDLLCEQAWPQVNEKYLSEDQIEMIIQINGKKRGKLLVAKDADKDSIEKAALKEESIQTYIAEKNIAKIIVVPGRLVNLVVKG